MCLVFFLGNTQSRSRIFLHRRRYLLSMLHLANILSISSVFVASNCVLLIKIFPLMLGVWGPARIHSRTIVFFLCGSRAAVCGAPSRKLKKRFFFRKHLKVSSSSNWSMTSDSTTVWIFNVGFCIILLWALILVKISWWNKEIRRTRFNNFLLKTLCSRYFHILGRAN